MCLHSSDPVLDSYVQESTEIQNSIWKMFKKS